MSMTGISPRHTQDNLPPLYRPHSYGLGPHTRTRLFFSTIEGQCVVTFSLSIVNHFARWNSITVGQWQAVPNFRFVRLFQLHAL